MRRVGWIERQVRQADRFQQRHVVLAFPWAVAQKFGNDQAGGKAALMAYYGLFALFPLLLLLATILGFALSGDPALREQLIDSALGNIPVIGTDLRSEVHPLQGNTVGLVIGVIGTLYGSLGVGFAAQNAMNTVWNIPYVRWPSLGTRYARTFGVIGLLGLASVSSTALAAFATAVARGWAVTVVAVAASSLVNLGLFLLAFMVLTAEPLRAREVAVGALVATVFWEALQVIGTWYVARGLRTASPTYGVFAVVITLLSWLYLGSQLVLWAAEINVVLRYRLWPRSVTQPPLTRADRLVLRRLAEMEVRRPEQEVTASFTDAADEDPLSGAE
ncbi:MAG TPA: YhjD/YihY/BrkB family envelope integrity protein [Streptosporangiaceae bacterium]|nr:YhjD/YihY/BrkB family envelope integrity protein [Streptosporangiaceae bacterium]